MKYKYCFLIFFCAAFAINHTTQEKVKLNIAQIEGDDPNYAEAIIELRNNFSSLHRSCYFASDLFQLSLTNAEIIKLFGKFRDQHAINYAQELAHYQKEAIIIQTELKTTLVKTLVVIVILIMMQKYIINTFFYFVTFVKNNIYDFSSQDMMKYFVELKKLLAPHDIKLSPNNAPKVVNVTWALIGAVD